MQIYCAVHDECEGHVQNVGDGTTPVLYSKEVKQRNVIKNATLTKSPELASLIRSTLGCSLGSKSIKAKTVALFGEQAGNR